MTFKVYNHGSKYPYLLHKMGFVDSQFDTTVSNLEVSRNFLKKKFLGQFEPMVLTYALPAVPNAQHACLLFRVAVID